MFEVLRSDLLAQVEAAVRLYAIYGKVRGHIASLAPFSVRTHLEEDLTQESPSLTSWRVYDHCAALTRAYSILEIFVGSLTRDVCSLLPDLHLSFEHLPERTRITYRKGFAKILGELEEKAYHRQIDLVSFTKGASQCFSNETPYQLAPEPFLVHKKAFRLPQFLDHLANLGFHDVEQRLLGHVGILRITDARSSDSTPKEYLAKKLNDFIEGRNLAAHTDVTDVWGDQDIKGAFYFVRDLCLATLDLVERSLIELMFKRSQLRLLGVVTETHSSRKGVVIVPIPGTIRCGDEVYVVRDQELRLTIVQQLQVNDASVDGVQSDGRTEVGMLLTVNNRPGDSIYSNPESLNWTSSEVTGEEEVDEEVEDLSDIDVEAPSVQEDILFTVDPPFG